ncbi:hypothetical protein ACFS5M_08140 [Lacinutrix iliipiscaria]|uniref:Uncharacterized protein n=1 Tax=Lacinutrix iliipiscaria TaxID=1230532 RepID=A0ABW5WN61_9FLAO
MKKVSDFQMFLIFLLILVVVFCFVPIPRIEAIGDFFKKIITPLAIPLSVIISAGLGLKKYMKIKKGKSP